MMKTKQQQWKKVVSGWKGRRFREGPSSKQQEVEVSEKKKNAKSLVN